MYDLVMLDRGSDTATDSDSPLRFARNVLAEILFRTRFRSLADSARYSSTFMPQIMPSRSTPSGTS